MDLQGVLEIVANLAAILTAGVAVWAYGQFRWSQRARRLALEAHLKSEKLMSRDAGKRTVPHLMAYLGMTEAEVLHAAFASEKVMCSPGMDEQGRANRLYFEYDDDELPQDDRL